MAAAGVALGGRKKLEPGKELKLEAGGTEIDRQLAGAVP